MKLLKKEEIAKAKAVDKQREIQEGLKLAKRVDALRETQAEEELSLRLFREKTLKAIHEETTKAATERDNILSVVKNLREDRINLLKPLDDEWKALEDAQRGFLREKATLVESGRELEYLRAEADHNLQTILDKVHQTEGILEQARKLASTADDNEKETKTALTQAKKVLDDAQMAALKSLTDSDKRERKIERMDSLLQEKENILNAKETDLKAREIALRDGQETLLRAKNRK